MSPRRDTIQVDVCDQVGERPEHESLGRPLEQAIVEAVGNVVREAGLRRAVISVAIVDDPTMHELNRRHLDHDYPTDVLSFVLERSGDRLEGEIIVSADTAAACAAEYGWSAAAELLLYVVHGALHLVGHDDHEEADQARMRALEAQHLARLGLQIPVPVDEPESRSPLPESRTPHPAPRSPHPESPGADP